MKTKQEIELWRETNEIICGCIDNNKCYACSDGFVEAGFPSANKTLLPPKCKGYECNGCGDERDHE